MKVTPDNPTPFFEQIADQIRASVAAGIYLPGEPIPSIRSQATRLLMNPNTIQRAYEQLEREGLIESRKGLGMFVAPRAAQVAARKVEESVRSTFVQGVRLGSAAQLARGRVDELYRAAWSDGADKEQRR